MPMYEYRCNKCNQQFDVEQKMSDDPYKIHNHESDSINGDCGGELVKVFSSVGIVWKGSGFYKTDSRADSSTKTSKASKASGDSSAKTDSSAQSAPSTDSQVAGTSKPSESSSSNTSDSHKGALKVEKLGSKNKEKNK